MSPTVHGGREFDPFRIQLAGPHLVEASAGTGKTHAIGTLVLRLLVEPGPNGCPPPTVDQILVVTFTNAATAELHDRLRRRIVATMAALSGRPPEDPADVDDVFLAWVGGVAEPTQARDRLERALRDFDDAAIFTIHGFCHRMLHEFAFESRVDFDVELVGDQTDIVNNAIHDYWARLTYEAPPTPVALLQAGGKGLGTLEAVGQAAIRFPRSEIVPQRPKGMWSAADLAGVQARYDAAVGRAAAVWRDRGAIALERIARAAEAGDIHRGRCKPDTVRGAWREALDAFFQAPQPWPAKETRKAIEGVGCVPERANKGKSAPSDPFIDACAALHEEIGAIEEELGRWALAVRHDLLCWLAEELPARKRSARQQSFDDLLHRLHRALHDDSPAAARLARRVRGRFRAALIDEFQDTDQVQYDIFRAVFAPEAGTDADGEPHPLLLVGDPKQAIYAFRGADVFAYLTAVGLVGPERRHTLPVNYRSDRSLVAALTSLWSEAPRPFLFEDIPFTPVRAHHGDRVDPADPPLAFAYIPAEAADPDGAGKAPSAETSRRAAARAAARAIARLLAERPKVWRDGADETVTAADVAVLVRKNDQARRMQRALRDEGVPSVLSSEASVLEQAEALELRRILGAMLAPSDAGQVRSALATSVLGVDGHGLLALAEDEVAWETWVERFRAWQRQWRRSGLLPAVRAMLDERGAVAALLALPDGERRLTNLTHVAELLHTAAFERALGPEALVAWFDRMLADRDERDRTLGDTGQMRLESDAAAVRVVTIHKAKGLQYGFVFCPFLYDGGGPSREVKLIHDLAGDRRPRLDIQPEKGGPTEVAEKLEGMSEDLRLLYVALTRARHRCWVAWGPLYNADASALGYVLGAPALAESAPSGDDPAAMTQWLEAVQDAAAADVQASAAATTEADDPLWRRLRALVQRAPGLIDAERLSAAGLRHGPFRAAPMEGRATDRAPASDQGRGARTLSHRPARQLVRSSFTALARGEREALAVDPSDGVDRDALSTAEAEAEAGPEPQTTERVPLADLRGGVRLGTGLHVLMDGLDYAQPDRWAARAKALADRRVLPAEAVEPLVGALDAILGTPLGVGDLAFSLREVRRADRLDEMQYVLPVAVEVHDGRFAARSKGHGARPTAGKDAPAVRQVGLGDLARAMAEHPGGAMPPGYPDRMRALTADAFAGWLSGALDLVFRRRQGDGAPRWYVLDWKSNRLGATWSDYAPERLVAEMARHHYFLQAHLYALALHRHLRLRQSDYAYDRHFGGVLYLFVRGMRTDRPGSGVVYDRPPEARMAALDALLAEGAP